MACISRAADEARKGGGSEAGTLDARMLSSLVAMGIPAGDCSLTGPHATPEGALLDLHGALRDKEHARGRVVLCCDPGQHSRLHMVASALWNDQDVEHRASVMGRFVAPAELHAGAQSESSIPVKLDPAPVEEAPVVQSSPGPQREAGALLSPRSAGTRQSRWTAVSGLSGELARTMQVAAGAVHGACSSCGGVAGWRPTDRLARGVPCLEGVLVPLAHRALRGEWPTLHELAGAGATSTLLDLVLLPAIDLGGGTAKPEEEEGGEEDALLAACALPPGEHRRALQLAQPGVRELVAVAAGAGAAAAGRVQAHLVLGSAAVLPAVLAGCHSSTAAARRRIPSEGGVVRAPVGLPCSSLIDAQDAQGCTLLCCAARAGHLDAVQALLAMGADPMLPGEDLEGREGDAPPTALHAAAQGGNLECVQALMDRMDPSHLVSILSAETNGKRALASAAGHPRVAELFSAARAALGIV